MGPLWVFADLSSARDWRRDAVMGVSCECGVPTRPVRNLLWYESHLPHLPFSCLSHILAELREPLAFQSEMPDAKEREVEGSTTSLLYR